MIYFSDIVETTADTAAEPSESRKSSRRSARSTVSTTPEAVKPVTTPSQNKTDKTSSEKTGDNDTPNKATESHQDSLEINEPKKSSNAEKEKSSNKEKEKSSDVKTPKGKSSKRLAAVSQQGHEKDKEETLQPIKKIAVSDSVDESSKAKADANALHTKSTKNADTNPNASNKILDADTVSSVPIIKTSPLVIHHTLIMNDEKSSKASNKPSIDHTASPEKPRSNNPLRSIRKHRIAKGGENESSNTSVQSENTSNIPKSKEINKSFDNKKTTEDNKASNDITVESKDAIKTVSASNVSNKVDAKIADKSTTNTTSDKSTEKISETKERNDLNESMEETVENISAFLAKTTNSAPNVNESKEKLEKSGNTSVSKESPKKIHGKELAEIIEKKELAENIDKKKVAEIIDKKEESGNIDKKKLAGIIDQKEIAGNIDKKEEAGITKALKLTPGI